MVVFVICALPFIAIHGIAPHWARHVIETAAHAHISLSAVVEKGNLEH